MGSARSGRARVFVCVSVCVCVFQVLREGVTCGRTLELLSPSVSTRAEKGTSRPIVTSSYTHTHTHTHTRPRAGLNMPIALQPHMGLPR